MPCYHPASAVRLRDGSVKFVSGSLVDSSVFKLSCRQCIGCRLEHSRQWGIRCLDEAQMHSENSFLTLTVSPENVVKFGRSLDVVLVQKFLKRVRKELSPKRVRCFYCGEYTKAMNPHYHMLLFGHDFPDRKYFKTSESGFKLYRSPSLERLWPLGFSLIGDVTFESAAYVARYTLKKVGDVLDPERLVMKDTGEVLRPEFIAMSTGGRGGLGGIGTSWIKKFKGDVYPRGIRVVRGRDVRPPKFYDKLYAEEDPLGFEDLQFLRAEMICKEDNTSVRLLVKEEVTVARSKLFPRD